MSKKFRSANTMPSLQTAPSTPESILTGEDIALRLKLKSSTIYELTRRRNKRPLPAMRAGKVLRFYWSEVEKWLRGEDVA
jgi:excisionase family DNA binding protein